MKITRQQIRKLIIETITSLSQRKGIIPRSYARQSFSDMAETVEVLNAYADSAPSTVQPPPEINYSVTNAQNRSYVSGGGQDYGSYEAVQFINQLLLLTNNSFSGLNLPLFEVYEELWNAIQRNDEQTINDLQSAHSLNFDDIDLKSLPRDYLNGVYVKREYDFNKDERAYFEELFGEPWASMILEISHRIMSGQTHLYLAFYYEDGSQWKQATVVDRNTPIDMNDSLTSTIVGDLLTKEGMQLIEAIEYSVE